MRKTKSRGIRAIFPEIMSRNMFCGQCAENKMPSVGNFAVFFGENRNRFFYEKIEQDNEVNEYGFTPHIILNPSITLIEGKQVVVFVAYCGMHGCGVEIDPYVHQPYFLNSKDLIFSIEDFISLMNTKDKSYYVNNREFYSFK